MKYIYKYLLTSIFAVAMMTSCDEGFDELNTNPNALTSIDPVFQLNSAIAGSGANLSDITYAVTIVRQMITPFTGVGSGANINIINSSRTNSVWDSEFGKMKQLVDGINTLEDVPEKSNVYNMMRIYKAYRFMILTDTYGEVPYSEAAQGYLNGIVAPIYDSQQSIYDDILNELESATSALNTSQGGLSQEVLYGGNVEQWKRFGNSVLLRAAMRLSKVDASKAQQYVTKAISGGLMQSNVDNAVRNSNSNNQNSMGGSLNSGEKGFYYLDEEFVDYLKGNNDPRLAVIAMRYVGAVNQGDQSNIDNAGDGDSSIGVQIGMPQGYDSSTIDGVAVAAGLASLFDYSTLDRKRLGSPSAPTYLVTYSQTQLLLAEAIVRGWATGDASEAYENGIRANMSQLSEYPGDTDIAEVDIDAYILANPLTTGNEIELINNQYWVSSFLSKEGWSNFRRTGYPNVSPNPLQGSLISEPFIRRLPFPDSESTGNLDNLNAAIGRQGADNLDTRVWWDKK